MGQRLMGPNLMDLPVTNVVYLNIVIKCTLHVGGIGMLIV